jgi:lincosamide nucleotidyltransferase A/C/D/E
VTESDVVSLYQALEARGIHIWIDGGWAVDALLGAQTRPHDDLDIVVEEKDLATMRSFLESQGYRDLPRPDTRPWNFVLADSRGRKIDFHVIVLDAEGNGIYGPKQNGQYYPAAALQGRGVVGDVQVRCMSLEYQMTNHSGYALRESDRHDVRALAEKFGLELPPDHRAPRADRQ